MGDLNILIGNRLKELTFIKEFGFYLIEEAFNEEFCFVFHNISKNKKIRIKYYPCYADKSPFEGFSIAIKKHPFQFAEDTLIIENYLKYKKIEINYEKFSLLSYRGSFKERLNLFLEYIDNTFHKHLKGIIEGEEWETLPVNWGPYK